MDAVRSAVGGGGPSDWMPPVEWHVLHAGHVNASSSGESLHPITGTVDLIRNEAFA